MNNRKGKKKYGRFGFGWACYNHHINKSLNRLESVFKMNSFRVWKIAKNIPIKKSI